MSSCLGLCCQVLTVALPADARQQLLENTFQCCTSPLLTPSDQAMTTQPKHATAMHCLIECCALPSDVPGQDTPLNSRDIT